MDRCAILSTLSSQPSTCTARCIFPASNNMTSCGFTFDPMDEHELASLLLKMATLADDERRRLGEASYRIAANFAPDRFGEGLEQAAAVAVKLSQRKPGIIDRALLLAAA